MSPTAKTLHRFLMMAAGVALFVLSASAEPASSSNYQISYSDIGATGNQSQSTDYSATAIIRTAGASNTVSSSTSYAVTPAAAIAIPTAAIVDWQLY